MFLEIGERELLKFAEVVEAEGFERAGADQLEQVGTGVAGKAADEKEGGHEHRERHDLAEGEIAFIGFEDRAEDLANDERQTEAAGGREHAQAQERGGQVHAQGAKIAEVGAEAAHAWGG